MNQIKELPHERTHGLDFNYSVWTAKTELNLCTVPWNSDYRDVVKFANTAALDNYLLNNAGAHVNVDGATYARFGKPIALSVPYNVAQEFNYIRANNGDGRSYYYFITGIEYINPGTTHLYVQVDIFQTFIYSTTFGNCYIEHGHIGIANENAFRDHGREFLTVPEGFDVGGEYMIVDQWKKNIATAKDTPGVGSPIGYSVLVTTTVSLEGDPGTEKEPNLNSAKGSSFENLPNGAETYVFATLDHFKRFMSDYSDKPWITAGIVSIMAIPPYDTYEIPTVPTAIGTDLNVLKIDAGSAKSRITTIKENWRDSLPIPERYARLDKLKTYPYTMLEMTSYTGTPLVLKPESWDYDHATVVEMPHFAQPSPRLLFIPYRYNASGPHGTPGDFTDDFDDYGIFNDGGEFLDMATGIYNFPTFSIVNNSYIAYMASNSHGITFAHQSADWSQQRALAGNDNAYNQAGSSINTAREINRIGNNAAIRSTTLANETAGWQALQSVGNSAVNGLAQGGTGGAAAAALGVANAGAGYAIGANQRNQQLGIGLDASQGVMAQQTGNAGYMQDTNKAYADYAAKGDYKNAIAANNAKVQDARLIQPTTAGQLGGDAFTLANYKWGYDVKVKMIQTSVLNAVGEQMLRYGYAINRFGKMPSSLQVMENFTYWKLRETYITNAACPEQFKQALRGIFEKGVTVWSNPANIGTIDLADNAPLSGVTL